MADTPTPPKTTRRASVTRRAPGRTGTPAAAGGGAPETVETAARETIARVQQQLTDALRLAEEAADKVARDLPARFADQIRAAEAASERLVAQVRAAETAAAAVPERIAAEVKAGEAAVAQAVARLNAQVTESVAAATTTADRAARQVGDRLAEQIAATETAVAALREQAEANLQAIETAGRQISTVRDDALTSAGLAGSTVVEGLARAQKELADFVSERLRQDIELQTALLGSRSLEEVRELQSRFFQSAMSQYTDEAKRLVQLGSTVARQAFGRTDA